MRSRSLLLLLLLTVCAMYSQHNEQTSVMLKDSTLNEFTRAAERWISAYNGTDAAQLSPLYSEDALYISGHVPGLVADGRDRVIANFSKGMQMGGHLEGLEILSVHRSCDLATVLCRYDANNSGQKVSGRTLLVLKKIDSAWVIILHLTVV